MGLNKLLSIIPWNNNMHCYFTRFIIPQVLSTICNKRYNVIMLNPYLCISQSLSKVHLMGQNDLDMEFYTFALNYSACYRHVIHQNLRIRAQHRDVMRIWSLSCFWPNILPKRHPLIKFYRAYAYMFPGNIIMNGKKYINRLPFGPLKSQIALVGIGWIASCLVKSRNYKYDIWCEASMVRSSG